MTRLSLSGPVFMLHPRCGAKRSGWWLGEAAQDDDCVHEHVEKFMRCAVTAWPGPRFKTTRVQNRAGAA